MKITRWGAVTINLQEDPPTMIMANFEISGEPGDPPDAAERVLKQILRRAKNELVTRLRDISTLLHE